MLSRRKFLATTTAALAATGCATAGPNEIPIIDTHTHFYDPTRPEGVAWPEKNDSFLFRPVLPPEYLTLAQPLGIAGTVVVEASPRVEDNAWILQLASKEPFLLAHVGHLKPGTPDFARDLQRFAANPRFVGIRTGGWNIPLAPGNTDFTRDLRLLADRNLALDILGGPDQLPAIAKLAHELPSLRIVIDHCAGVRIDGQEPDAAWTANIRAAAARPNIHMKVSGLAENTGRPGNAPTDTAFYRPVLDILWDSFGPDRVIFGSNWPVSARFATLPQVLDIVRPYFLSKGRASAEKYFYRNAQRVYRVRI